MIKIIQLMCRNGILGSKGTEKYSFMEEFAIQIDVVLKKRLPLCR